jgi:two-component system NtrC family sensor kinase
LDAAELKEVDLNEGLESTITLIKHHFSDRIRLVREFGPIPRVRGNPGEMNQVFMNLLTNASEAIADEGTITARTFARDEHVYIEVSDTGVGIPSGEIERLFEPSISTKGVRAKAGLGLFTSYNIMKKHQGDIRVETEVGKGTTFTLVLPAKPRAAIA